MSRRGAIVAVSLLVFLGPPAIAWLAPLPSWSPLPIGPEPLDFIDGLFTMCAGGDASARIGAGIHLYRANRSMSARAFMNADGEMLIVPQQGRLSIRTELGVLDVRPGEIAVVFRSLSEIGVSSKR